MVAACLEDGLAVSYIKNIHIYDSAVAFLDTYPNKLKACRQPKTYTCFLTLQFINLGAIKVSFSGWMSKQTLVHPDNGILFSVKNKGTIKP